MKRPGAGAALALAGLVAGCTSATTAAFNATHSLDGITFSEDLAYGTAPRQLYDLYMPEDADATTPLVVFVHGGSWYDGDKNIYKFLAAGLAENGIGSAIINYRLAPDVIFPTFVEDAALAVAEIHANQPDRPLFLMGHSAGAQMAGLLTYDPRYLNAVGMSPCDVTGFIGVSGPYEFLPLVEQRFKDIFPVETRAETQPINYADGPTPPSLLLHGTHDGIVHAEDTRLMTAALEREGNAVEATLYDGIGHIDIIVSMSPKTDRGGPTLEDVTAFITAQGAAGYPACSAS